MSHTQGRTLSLTLGCLLALSGCVIHVHEKGEAEASTSSSSGGEGTSSTTTPPAAGQGHTAHHDTHEHDSKPGSSTHEHDSKPGTVTHEHNPGDRPVVHVTPKPTKPVVDNGKPDQKPVAGNDQKPADKPATGKDDKPATGKDDKPATGNTAQPGKDEKPSIVHDKPVLGGNKPVIIVEKPVHHDPQRTEPSPTDKTTSMHDRPVSYDGKSDEKKPEHLPLHDASKDAVRPHGNKPATGVSSATDPHKVAPHGATTPEKNAGEKPAVSAANEPVKGHLDKGALAGLGAEAGRSCKLFSAEAAAGDKIRLRVTGVDSGAEVELEGKPLKVVKRDDKAWVVQLEKDAKTGRLTVKHGDLTVACGKLQVK